MYTLSSIAGITGGRMVQQGNAAVIEHLAYDSRNILFAATSVFFAIRTGRHDGHDFIADAYRKGIRNFIVDSEVDAASLADASILKVNDTLASLQQLAVHHRQQFDIPVIGITGSNGKTIVKEWLYQLLHEDFRIVRSPRSYNSQLGVPLSVWQMNHDHQLAIFEAGISMPGEMDRLENMIRPTIGVLTNIGDAHSANFDSTEQKLAEKLRLFQRAEAVIGPAERVRQVPSRLFTWNGRDATLSVRAVDKRADHTNITAIHHGQEKSIVIPFTDDASIQNAVTCWCVTLQLGADEGKLRTRFRELHPVDMRLQLRHGMNGCLFINDSYSADTDSLKIALDFQEQQSSGLRKTVILSEFQQASRDEKELYSAIARMLFLHGVHRVIAVGERLHDVLRHQLSEDVQYHFYFSTDDLIRDFRSSYFFNEIILIKGARPFGFERVAQLFEQKQHQTVLEVDLNALAHNLRAYQRLLPPGTKTMAMVKAFSYGSGGAEIASVLQYHNADYLGVAYADEGVELVKAGITLPVMVMNAEESSFRSIVDYNLQPVIYSFDILDSFEQYLGMQGLASWPVHIEIDTGMKRLGFDASDIIEMSRRIGASSCVKVHSVFSHLAASDDPLQDDFTAQQASRFQDAVNTMRQHLRYPFLTHIANSAAVVRHPELHMDMVRLGIGLYGVEIENSSLPDLMAVATLRSTVAQLRTVKKGESISYNRRSVMTRDSIIATVRIGYADGYSRRLGNGRGRMMVNGHLAPVTGTVCMDMTMLDVTDIPGVREGDDVIIFGADLPLQRVASWMETIPYEVMTGISQRVKRVYFHE
ncbi:MAG TPA: bifunctional UDP-N-acetylmuramoyl-tripeptide:D-alanyl-D-alanine ligase/alanine racemase [Flavisolibacter sp.]